MEPTDIKKKDVLYVYGTQFRKLCLIDAFLGFSVSIRTNYSLTPGRLYMMLHFYGAYRYVERWRCVARFQVRTAVLLNLSLLGRGAIFVCVFGSEN
jgi:hypothetical protein